ncbi:MAG: hypothetical protein IPH66_13425 [Crocinitomicaceae bacterium]|nr:hypothetical protein [Crocinitomicaceae bacterium]
MKKYYLKNGEKVTGPFMLDDLKYQRISSTTLVSVDQGPWQEITSVDDLKSILEFAGINTAPKVSSNPPIKSIQQKPSPENQINIPANKKFIVLAVAIAVFMMGLGMAVLLFAELK